MYFKTSSIAVLEATWQCSFFKPLNIVKNQIHFNTSKREASIWGAFFGVQADGLIIGRGGGGLKAGEGAYKQKFTV